MAHLKSHSTNHNRAHFTRYLLSQYQSKSAAFGTIRNGGQKNSLVHINRVDQPLGDSEVVDKAVNEWGNSSQTMNDILMARKIEYFEFIQPNQYHETNRHFGEEENKIAITEGSLFGRSVSIGYPKLLARMTSLQDAGIKVFNGVGIFDETKGIVYLDNCCH
jgi:hypothetical protein